MKTSIRKTCQALAVHLQRQNNEKPIFFPAPNLQRSVNPAEIPLPLFKYFLKQSPYSFTADEIILMINA